jgi:membrane associated rhomboid family serine protease/antitoxin component YwqK of YwqJK toxin-antitoxin module
MEFIKQSKITLALIALNVLVFMYTYGVSGTLKDPHFTLVLLNNGGLFNPLTLDSQPWRILSSMFLHGGILHLLFNQYALFSVGTGWERHIGWKKWAAVYFVCGVAAGLTSLWWNLFAIGVGASGAIFGLFGFIMVELWRLNRAQGTSNNSLLVNFAVFLIINIAMAEVLHADNSAHIGGLVCGMSLSGIRRLFHARSIKPELTVLGILVVIFFLLPRTQVKYYNAFQRVMAVEDSTRFLFNKKLSDAALVSGLRNINTQWDSVSRQIKIISPMVGDLDHDTLALQQYVRLTRQENGYKISMIEKESYVYMDSIEILQQKSDSLPKIKYYLNFKEPTEEQPKQSNPSNLTPTTIYYDSNWVETPYRPFEFYRVGQRDSIGRWQGPVRDYYKNDRIQMKGAYLDNLHHGIFIYYTRNNTYEAAGRLDHDLRIGKWEIFHPNGKLEREVFYGDREYVRNVWDSTGRQLVVNGNGYYESKRINGTIQEAGYYRNGLKDGLWKGFHANNQPYFEEVFLNGRLISGKSISLAGRNFQYDETSMLALPNGGMRAFQEYVQKTARLFTAKRPGTVKLYFRVTTDNRIADIIIQKSLDVEADGWAKDILLKGPQWNPARLHGQEITDGFGFMTVEFE